MFVTWVNKNLEGHVVFVKLNSASSENLKVYVHMHTPPAIQSEFHFVPLTYTAAANLMDIKLTAYSTDDRIQITQYRN